MAVLRVRTVAGGFGGDTRRCWAGVSAAVPDRGCRRGDGGTVARDGRRQRVIRVFVVAFAVPGGAAGCGTIQPRQPPGGCTGAPCRSTRPQVKGNSNHEATRPFDHVRPAGAVRGWRRIRAVRGRCWLRLRSRSATRQPRRSSSRSSSANIAAGDVRASAGPVVAVSRRPRELASEPRIDRRRGAPRSS